MIKGILQLLFLTWQRFFFFYIEIVGWSIRSLGNPVCQIDTSEALAIFQVSKLVSERESDIFLLFLFFLALFVYSFNIFRVGSLDLWHSLLIIHNK